MPTGNVKTYGIAEEDNTLAARNTINDVDGISGSISYQWKRDGSAISGATASTYTLIQDDVGAAITVTASYSDEQGTAESVTSSATSAVGNVNDEPTGLVTISGTATEGQVLTASNTIADADGLGSFSYQWKRDGSVISGATASTYTLLQADVGAAIMVTASYIDGQGTAESVTSCSKAAVANVNDIPTGAVTISGTHTQGETFTAVTSVITWGSSWGGDSSAVSDQLSSGVVSFADPFQDDRLVFAGSGSGLTSDPSPALTLTIDTSAPAFTSAGTAAAIDENSGAAQVVYTASTSDLSPVIYSLKPGNNDDAAAFSIDSTSGQVTLSVDPDHETQSSYAFTVVATDAAGNSSEQAVALAVNDLNEDPTNLLISASVFDENITADSVVATFSSTDPDDGDTFTYSLVSGSGDTDNSAFSIDGDQLKIVGSPDFQTQESYSVRLQTTDAGGLPFKKAFTLFVNDIEEEPNSGDTLAEYGQISVNQNWQTIDLDQTYTNAVIIASDPTLKGGDPVAVRIRNVGTDSFQIRLQEPNYKDGSHTNETISYVVADAGDWELSDGTRISVGTQTGNKLSSSGFETIDLESGFTGSPAVLTQTQTFNGSDWVTTRTKDIGTDSFQVTMQEEEQLNGGSHVKETIGWIAVDSGDSNDGDTQLASGLTADVFTDQTETHTFGSSFDSAPTLLTKLATFDGADVANSRIKSVSNTGFSAMVQEEQSKDSGVAHTTESLAFFAIGGTSGTFEATKYQSSTREIGEYGQISVNHHWKSINLTNTYTSPIVITSDPTIKGGDPTVVRLRNIDSNSFDLKLQEPNYKDGSHTNEDISYVVLEEGSWNLTDGTQIAAGSKNTNKLSTQGREKISFDDSFTSGPAVLAQTQTFNGRDWVTTRTDAITGQSFDVMMQEEEQLNSGIHVTETIGWVAMDQGVATDGDTIIEGGVTPDVFTDQTKTHIFEDSFDSAPTLLTKLSTFDGADVANSRIQLVSSTEFSAMVQEEQSKDSELRHTTEMLAYLAFDGSSGTIEAVI